INEASAQAASPGHHRADDLFARLINRVEGFDAEFTERNVLRAAERGDRAEESQRALADAHLDRDDQVLWRFEIRLAPSGRDVGVAEDGVQQFAHGGVAIPDDFAMHPFEYCFRDRLPVDHVWP